MALQPYPFRGSAGEMLALPDWHGCLDELDQFGAGREGLGTVRGGDSRDESRVAHGEGADAVRGGGAQVVGRGDGFAGVGEKAAASGCAEYSSSVTVAP